MDLASCLRSAKTYTHACKTNKKTKKTTKKTMGVYFYLMVLVEGGGEFVGAEGLVEIPEHLASKQARLLLCGFDGDKNDQQNDPAHQGDDV